MANLNTELYSDGVKSVRVPAPQAEDIDNAGEWLNIKAKLGRLLQHVEDGKNETLGATDDAVSTGDLVNAHTLIALTKRLVENIETSLTAIALVEGTKSDAPIGINTSLDNDHTILSIQKTLLHESRRYSVLNSVVGVGANTAAVVAIGASNFVEWCRIEVNADQTGKTLLIGDDTRQTMSIGPSEAIEFERINMTSIYVKNGDTDDNTQYTVYMRERVGV